MPALTLTPITPTPFTLSPVSTVGLVGDGVTDNYAAIMAAYNDLPSTGGALHFRAGVFKIGQALSFTSPKPLAIIGEGRGTVLAPSFAGGDAITVNGPSLFSMSELGVVPSVSRTSGTYDLHVLNCTRPTLSSVYLNNGRGGLLMFEACNFLQMVNCGGDSNDNVGGDTCLRIKSVGGTISNCLFRTGPFASGGYSSSKPCLYVTGQSTSLHFDHSTFTGGGPRSKWTISGIVSTGANFTVTTSATHDFLAGDFVAIRGASVAAYNNAWRIASVGATTIVVTSAANPGAASGGTAESLTACAYVSNEDGAVNESTIASVLFEAGQPNLYGSVGLYFDGRRPYTNREISGWTLNGNYHDFGTVGLMLSGKAASGSNDPSCFGFSVEGGKFESSRSAIHIEGTQSVTVNGFVPNSNVTPSSDNIAVDGVGAGRPFEIYLNSGAAAPYTQGVTINGNNLGPNADWFAAHEARAKDNAIFIAGGANLHELVVTGNTLYGHQFAVGDDGSYGGRWKFEGNLLHYGGTLGANELPSVASATTLNIWPYHEVQKVTGTTNIQNINPQWPGKKVTFLFTGALSLVTAGNLAIAANRTVLAGDMVTLVSDGTSWYVR